VRLRKALTYMITTTYPLECIRFVNLVFLNRFMASAAQQRTLRLIRVGRKAENLIISAPLPSPPL
jgi:hypothetical protein